jgi:hypothetical protein
MSIPYNEGKNENLFMDKKENSSIFILENNSNNNINDNNPKIFGHNKNNENGFLYYNDGYNKNNINSNINAINNLYNFSYYSGYPSGIYLNTNNNNNNINYDYLYNKNNIIFNINNNNNIKKNEEKKNLQAAKKEIIPKKQNASQNKLSISFKVDNMNKIDSITSNDDKNSIPNNNKHIFIIEEDKKIENDKLDESKIKGDNINNEISESKNIIELKIKIKKNKKNYLLLQIIYYILWRILMRLLQIIKLIIIIFILILKIIYTKKKKTMAII